MPVKEFDRTERVEDTKRDRAGVPLGRPLDERRPAAERPRAERPGERHGDEIPPVGRPGPARE